jgi:uncharacterized membrane protein
MGKLSQAKTLGGVGSILVILTAVPLVGFILGIVGLVLILVAVKDISEAVNDRSIFNNMIISFFLGIVGLVVAGLVIVGSFLTYIGLRHLPGPNFNPSTVPTGNLVGFVLSVIAGLVVFWVVLTISAVFLRRSYGSIATRLNVSMFGTAGLVYLIGAATAILLVGFLLLFVAQILTIVAFFSIEEAPPIPPGAQPSPVQPPPPM